MIKLKTQTELFNQVLHFLSTKTSARKYKICRVLLPNISILSFLRNCCNVQVTVSFVSANNLETLLSVHSSIFANTCKLMNRYFVSERPIDQLSGTLSGTVQGERSVY